MRGGSRGGGMGGAGLLEVLGCFTGFGVKCTLRQPLLQQGVAKVAFKSRLFRTSGSQASAVKV